MGQPLQRLGLFVGQARADARRVQLGRRQQCAQFVMQVARQVGPFVLPRGQEVPAQLGQLGRALLDQAVQAVALDLDLALERLLVRHAQAGLAQVQVQRQQAECGQRRHAGAAEYQGAVERLAAGRERCRRHAQQLAAQHPYRLHLLLADVAAHQVNHRSAAALVLHAYRQRQLGQLGVGRGMQLAQHLTGLGSVLVVGLQVLESGFAVDQRLVVGHQIVPVLRQQVAALAALGVEQAALETEDAFAPVAPADQVLQSADRLPVRALADEQHRHRCDTGQRKHHRAALDDGDERDQIHFEPLSQTVGSSGEERCHPP